MSPDPFIWVCPACGAGHNSAPAYCCFACGHPKNAIISPAPTGGLG